MTLSKVTAKNDPPKSTRREHIETQILEGVRYGGGRIVLAIIRSGLGSATEGFAASSMISRVLL